MSEYNERTIEQFDLTYELSETVEDREQREREERARRKQEREDRGDPEPKRYPFIAGIFYCPFTPTYYSFQILTDLWEIPVIRTWKDWHGEYEPIVREDEDGKVFIETVSVGSPYGGWKTLLGPQLAKKDPKLAAHLLAHPDRYPVFLCWGVYDTWEEAEAVRTEAIEWYLGGSEDTFIPGRAGGWEFGVSELRAFFKTVHPNEKIGVAVAIKDEDRFYPFPSIRVATDIVPNLEDPSKKISETSISRASLKEGLTAGGYEWVRLDLETGEVLEKEPSTDEETQQRALYRRVVLAFRYIDYWDLSYQEKADTILEIFKEVRPDHTDYGGSWAMAVDPVTGVEIPFPGDEFDRMIDFHQSLLEETRDEITGKRKVTLREDYYYIVDDRRDFDTGWPSLLDEIFDMDIELFRWNFYDAFFIYCRLYVTIVAAKNDPPKKNPIPAKDRWAQDYAILRRSNGYGTEEFTVKIPDVRICRDTKKCVKMKRGERFGKCRYDLWCDGCEKQPWQVFTWEDYSERMLALRDRARYGV